MNYAIDIRCRDANYGVDDIPTPLIRTSANRHDDAAIQGRAEIETEGENEERKSLGESMTNGCVLPEHHQPENKSQKGISENSQH